MGLFERIRETQMRARSGATRNGRIAAARAMMAQATRTANGVDANSTVTAATQTGALADTEPVIEIGLTVIPDGDLPPYPATITQPVRALLLERLQVGSHLAVKVDPDDPKHSPITKTAAQPPASSDLNSSRAQASTGRPHL